MEENTFLLLKLPVSSEVITEITALQATFANSVLGEDHINKLDVEKYFDHN